jgi:hypothetical protein
VHPTPNQPSHPAIYSTKSKKRTPPTLLISKPSRHTRLNLVLSKTLRHKVEDTLSISPTWPLDLLYLLDYFPLRHRIRVSNFEPVVRGSSLTERTVLPHLLDFLSTGLPWYSGTEYSICFDEPPAPLIIPNYGFIFRLSKCDMMLSQNLILYCITRSGSQ